MNAGDLMRTEAQTGAALMPLVVSAIRRSRQQTLLAEGYSKDFEEIELYNHCYIIDSLKHPKEVEALRSIYGSKFVMVSAVLPQGQRKANLKAKVAKSYAQTDEGSFDDKADFLIKKDKRRSGVEFGQNISGAFHLADFFIRADDCIEKDARRLFRILFGDPNATPTRNEFVMFEARSNALRSADLSRQVGAVITNAKLEIISRGCNDVPIPGGDTFWPDERDAPVDTRDYAQGRDYNAIKKVEILSELLDYLIENEIVKVESGNRGPGDEGPSEKLVKDLVFGNNNGVFSDLRVSNLIEFGRMVHAEMFALMEAARRGLSVENGTLYCTTFPCHMCARHIIAAGIRDVIYIEPYPKSMTQEIYGDMIDVEADPNDLEQSRQQDRPQKVYFQAFHGTAPRMFRDAFEMTTRKDKKGYALPFDEEQAQPKWIPLSNSHLPLEGAFASILSAIPYVNDVTQVTAEGEQ